MKKHLVLGLCLLTGVLNATSAMAANKGIEKTIGQLETLNTCIASYIEQVNTIARFEGGSLTDRINWQTNTGEPCASIVDPETSSITSDGVMTVMTFAGSPALPLNAGQKFVLAPFTDLDGTAYSRTAKTGAIATWKITYTPASSGDLRAAKVLSSEVNLLANLDSPLNSVT